MGGIDIYYDDTVKRLNTDAQGELIGNFKGADKILVLYSDGSYEMRTYDLNNRWEGRGKIEGISKIEFETVISAIHQDGESGRIYVKRFHLETSSIDQKFTFISESEGSKLWFVTTQPGPVVKVTFSKKSLDDMEVDLEEYIDVKGWKANGNKLTDEKVRKVEMVRFRAPAPEPEKPVEDIPFEVVDARDKKEETKDDDSQTKLF